MLITFCNQIGKNALLNGKYLLEGVSATGATQDDNNIYVVSQRPTPTLFTIDKATNKVKSEEIEADDSHSIAVKGDSLYIVSTGENSVVEYSLKNLRNRKVIWKPEEPHHINSIFIKKDIYVSAFGKYEGTDRDTATDGYIYNISKDKKLLSGIKHPHSLIVDDAIYYCASAEGKVYKGRKTLFHLPGKYLRGLAIKDGILSVGVSRRRKEEKDTGSAEFEGECKVLKYDLTQGEFIEEMKFDNHYEIYDIANIIHR